VNLKAGGGLTLQAPSDGAWTIAWGCDDWFGPLDASFAGEELAPCAGGQSEGEDDLGAFRALELALDGSPLPLRVSVRAYLERALLVFRLEAAAPLHGFASGRFDRPAVVWPRFFPARRRAGGLPEGTRGFGHAYTEFALPSFSEPELDGFLLLPQRPAVVEPLFLVAPDGRSLMLAPLDSFHEQVVAVPRRGETELGVRCGWQGDLNQAPEGFHTELACFAGESPRSLLDEWAAILLRRHGTRRPSRYADDGVGRLSYWTDNGAAYWYRSEPGLDVATTLERTVAGLREARVPIRAVQLDSWFYPHQNSRPLNPDWGMDVPPTGMLCWEPREDLLPGGLSDLRDRMGDPPLILHSRHFSSQSPYFEETDAWIDGDRGHPIDTDFYERLMAQAAGWGAITYEQDWLIECFLGVRGLREAPGRARAWQEGIDAAAHRHGRTLQWCMASPADFMQTVTLEHVTSIRTSGDYRYIIGSGALWAWFLYTNALARALGLTPYKDVFFSSPLGEGWDGDSNCECEALLAALSSGPVGIGDRLGRTDRELVMRTCREDGMLVKPDVPVAALESCYRGHPQVEPHPLVGEAHTRHPAGFWHYLVGIHVWRGEEPILYRFALEDLGPLRPEGPLLAYDFRRGHAERVDAGGADPVWEVELEPRAWDYRVLCPILPGEIAIVGDVSRYVTAGDARLRDVRASECGVVFEALGSPGERFEVTGWSGRPPRSARALGPAGGVPLPVRYEGGLFHIPLVVGDRGWLRIRIDADSAGEDQE
jgi:hypothetical protein